MPCWLPCCGPPNAVADAPTRIEPANTAVAYAGKQRGLEALDTKLPGNKTEKHVAFETVSFGAGAYTAVDASASLSRHLAAAIKANADQRPSPDANGICSAVRSPPGATSFCCTEEDLLHRAALQDQADYGGQLPLVSQRSLEMAFHRAAQAVAVVQVASRTPVKPGSSDAACSHLEPVAEHPTGFHQATAYSRAASVRVSMLHSDDGGCPATDESAASEPMHTASTGQQQPAAAIEARLEPVFLNKALKQMLDARDFEEFTFTMDKQLCRNPMLAMLFENCVQRLLAGKDSSVRQYTPLFSSPTSVHPTAQATFINLQINSCAYKDANGRCRPALFLWYNAPSSQFDLTSQLKRNYMALASVPSMVAVVSLDGRVLQQNSSSVAYMGFAMGSTTEGTHLGDPRHTLQRLFVRDPCALDEMLDALQQGKTWQGQVHMLPQLELAETCGADRADVIMPWTLSDDGSEATTHFYKTPAAAAASEPGSLPVTTAAAAATSWGTGHGSDEGSNLMMMMGSARTTGGGSSISLPNGLVAGLRAGSCSLSSKMGNSRAMQMFFSSDRRSSHDRQGRTGSNTGSVSSRHPSSNGASCTGEGMGLASPTPFRTASGKDVWHRVQASKFSDPVTGEDVILLIHTDITQRVASEKQLQQVLNAEHRVLEGIFPKQVLQVLTKSAIRNHIQSGAVCGIRQEEELQDMARGGVLPPTSCRALTGRAGKISFALKHEQVSIMFADIAGFTCMAKEVEPHVVMEFLNDLYTRFDDLLEEYDVYKVETIGDCYMVAGGLIFTDSQGFKSVLQSQVDPLHAHRAFAFAVAMLEAARGVYMPGSNQPVKMRVGIHSGPIVSGIVGSRMPRFCLFGDSVNTASRMESSNKQPGWIHVSDVTKELISGDFWQDAGQEEIKGKGLMSTYYCDPTAAVTSSRLAAVLDKVRAASCPNDSRQHPLIRQVSL